MSDQDDQDKDQEHEQGESGTNPFAIGDEQEGEQEKVSLSPRRAAMLGLTVGLFSVGLLLVCFLGSVALAACTDV